jgi:hypothetical protein
MNFPVHPLRSIWFADDKIAIVTQIANVFEDTVKYVMPAGKESLHHDLLLNAQYIDNALTPILILMKNLAAGNEKACKILREKFMPSNLYF